MDTITKIQNMKNRTHEEAKENSTSTTYYNNNKKNHT